MKKFALISPLSVAAPQRRPRALTLMLLALLLGCPAAAKEAWSGSSVTYRNTVSVVSLQKDTDLTYNPYYAMTLSLKPQWWLNDIVYAHLRFGLSRELTNSDITSSRGETWASDLTLRVGGDRFYTLPVVGLALSADLDVIAPTSPISQARTKRIGLGPSIGVRRDFDLLSGLTLGYTFRATWNAYKFTTAQREVPLIPGCNGPDCGAHFNLGLRNPQWRLTHSFFLSFAPAKWVSLGVSAALVTDYLHDATLSDRASVVPQTPQNQRFLVSTDIALTFTPMRSLAVTVGVDTTNPQLAPDSTFRAPFFNRYTTVYLDLTLNVAGLVSQVRD